MEACLTTHEHPEDQRGEPFLPPTRLVKLEENGCRLCLGGQLERNPTYVTLSHCWGSVEKQADIFKLRKENLETLCCEIPLGRLCKTFQDAIVVTRSLGYEYIWIDSLCIIQGDEEDWRNESSLMSTVYGNGIVNISATAAKDGSEGLFFQRDGEWDDRQWLETSEGDNWELHDPALFPKAVNLAPISRRGWVFQERCLSQRVLHFTDSQIFLE